MSFEKWKPEITRLIKFNIVGVMNTVIDFIIFFLCVSLFKMVIVPAQIIAYSMGIINSYFMNRFWTFQIKKKQTRKEFILFVVINLFSLILSTVLIQYLLKLLSSLLIAKLIVTAIIMVINYLGQRFIVFKTVKKDNIK